MRQLVNRTKRLQGESRGIFDSIKEYFSNAYTHIVRIAKNIARVILEMIGLGGDNNFDGTSMSSDAVDGSLAAEQSTIVPERKSRKKQI